MDDFIINSVGPYVQSDYPIFMCSGTFSACIYLKLDRRAMAAIYCAHVAYHSLLTKTLNPSTGKREHKEILESVCKFMKPAMMNGWIADIQ